MAPTKRRAAVRRVSLSAAAAGVLATLVTVPAEAASQDAQGQEGAVVEWIDRNAVPLRTTDPADPLGDLGSLRRVVGPATVVGLGESAHGSRELFRVKHRMARYLVERMGFGTVAMEHDFAQGVEVDRYVLTGQGNPREIVERMGFPFWQCEEILDLVRWMRSYNRTHHQKVRFLGTDITALRDVSFDEVTGYVRHVAPGRLAELEPLLKPLQPRQHGEDSHVEWYRKLQPSQRRELIEDARRAGRLVREVPATAPRLEREYAEQHARAILGWYEAFDHADFSPPREQFIADTIAWWQRAVGGRVAYWAANVHVTESPSVTYRQPFGGWTGRTAGGHLRERLAGRYVTIGSVFHQGSISSNWSRPGAYPIGAPPPGILDATLGRARRHDYLIDLRGAAPRPVRDWRDGPMAKRMILPSYGQVGTGDGADYLMSVPSLLAAFDAFVHVRTTTASRLFARDEGRGTAGPHRAEVPGRPSMDLGGGMRR